MKDIYERSKKIRVYGIEPDDLTLDIIRYSHLPGENDSLLLDDESDSDDPVKNSIYEENEGHRRQIIINTP